MEESTHALHQTGLVLSPLQYSLQFMVGFLWTQITLTVQLAVYGRVFMHTDYTYSTACSLW